MVDDVGVSEAVLALFYATVKAAKPAFTLVYRDRQVLVPSHAMRHPRGHSRQTLGRLRPFRQQGLHQRLGRRVSEKTTLLSFFFLDFIS